MSTLADRYGSELAETWDDLDEYLAEIPGGDLGSRDVNPELADRMVRHVARARRQIAQAEELAKAEHDRIDEWLRRRREALDTSFVEMCLRTYHEARLEENPKAKTLHLPGGTLAARKLPDRWEFDDERFIAWARGRKGDFIRTKVEVDKPVAKRELQVVDGQVIDPLNGEVLDFVTVTPGETNFAVKTGEDAEQ